MTKLNSPLLSLEAHGSVGDTLTFQRIHKTDIVRSKPFPTDPQTFPQLAHRFIYWDIVQMWHELSVAERRQYEIDARRRKITAFNLFMSEELELASHLLSYLPLNEGVGSIARDFSPYHNHATIFGGTWTDGVFNAGIDQDGNDDYIKIPPKAYHTGLSEFTVEFAFIRHAPLEICFLFALSVAGVRHLFATCWSGSALNFYLRTTDNIFACIKAAAFPDAGVPFRLSLAWTGSLMRAVLNGTEIATKATTGTFQSFTPAKFYYGTRETIEQSVFGVIDDFRYYDVALTLTQQQRHTERTPR